MKQHGARFSTTNPMAEGVTWVSTARNATNSTAPHLTPLHRQLAATHPAAPLAAPYSAAPHAARGTSPRRTVNSPHLTPLHRQLAAPHSQQRRYNPLCVCCSVQSLRWHRAEVHSQTRHPPDGRRRAVRGPRPGGSGAASSVVQGRPAAAAGAPPSGFHGDGRHALHPVAGDQRNQ